MTYLVQIREKYKRKAQEFIVSGRQNGKHCEPDITETRSERIIKGHVFPKSNTAMFGVKLLNLSQIN